ncbi:hypothetical protein HMPREF1586_00331 [Gardnerella vaginalis JCP8522]|nr:hypothetical protein HMPREF1586_00331 [Gardnerella vaginalis JCP8522]
MCFKNHNSQNDSKVKTCKECIDDCKECIDKKTLDSISRWIGFFYAFLTAISVSAVFIFNVFNKINNSIECKVNCSTDCSICSFVCSFVNDIKTKPNYCILVYAIIYAIISSLYIFKIYSVYVKPQETKYKEIFNDLKANCVSMACSAASSVICLFISALFYSNNTIKITVSLTLLLVTCLLGLRAKSCNNEYALTKIYIDYMPTSSKYLTIGEREEERELLVIKKSFLRYYKTMETNYLMMSAFFAFVTSVLGMSSIDSLKSVSMLFVLNMAM